MNLRTGLVGAGPWAGMFHAPMLSAGEGTTLEAIWARRPEAAQALGHETGAAAVADFEELLERCDAIAFAVPPDVQAELAPRAAAAGKHLVLEKPLAFTLDGAERIADAVAEAGVQSVVMLRNRYTAAGRTFVEGARSAPARGGVASFVTGAALEGSPFATPWRIERGALFDLGPHVLDLMDAAMGPVEAISATGDPLRWISLLTEHEGGAIGQAALSITTPEVQGSLQCTVFTEAGPVIFDSAGSDADDSASAAVTRALATAVESGTPTPTDVQRGLHLQRLLDTAESSLASRDR